METGRRDYFSQAVWSQRSFVKLQNKIECSIRSRGIFIQNTVFAQLIISDQLKANQDRSTVVLLLWTFVTFLDPAWC